MRMRYDYGEMASDGRRLTLATAPILRLLAWRKKRRQLSAQLVY
jgi:hypothetical protein